MSPAIERMEHTHRFFFVFGRKCFYHGAYQNFQEPSAYGVYPDGNEKTGKRIRQKFRQERETDESGS